MEYGTYDPSLILTVNILFFTVHQTFIFLIYCQLFQLLGEKATTWQGYRFDLINEESSPELEEYKTEFSSHQAASEFMSVFSEVMIAFF